MSDDRTVPHQSIVVPVRTLMVEVTQGPDAGKKHVAVSDRMAIGSAQDNDLVLSDDTVSRYHLELQNQGNRILVQDLGSTNGTLVGSVWLDRARVSSGTVLTLGKSELRIDDGKTITQEVYDGDRLGDLRGKAPEMLKLMATIKRAAQSDASVLLLGETGVGKEVIADAVHQSSQRAHMPFEIVDCGALSPTLIASELFGHEKGAFTGADRQHVGAFERADGGTIFLDEIGELPPSLQTALLGALERGSFRRVGGQTPIKVNVRVVCATNRDLRAEVNNGTFRQDLYYRVAVVLLRIPPLRQRPEDIALLIEHFLREAGFSGEIDEIIPPKVMEALKTHRWPGNVRELRNFVEAALAMGEAPSLDGDGQDDFHGPGEFPENAQGFPTVPMEQLLSTNYKDARAVILNEFEGLYLNSLLERCDQNVSKAARESKIHRSYLNQMLKRHRLR